MSRAATNKIIEMVDEGLIDKDFLITCCLKYMSEDEVRDMAHANEIFWEADDSDYEDYEPFDDQDSEWTAPVTL